MTDMLKEELLSIKNNIAISDDMVWAPLELALCNRMMHRLPQVSFSKDSGNNHKTVSLPMKFDLVGLGLTSKDLVSDMMVAITDECVSHFSAYRPFIIHGCTMRHNGNPGDILVEFDITES